MYLKPLRDQVFFFKKIILLTTARTCTKYFLDLFEIIQWQLFGSLNIKIEIQPIQHSVFTETMLSSFNLLYV